MSHNRLEYKDKVKLDRLILILEELLLERKHLTKETLYELLSELCFDRFSESEKEEWVCSYMNNKKIAIKEFNILINFWRSFKNNLIMERKISDIPVENSYRFIDIFGAGKVHLIAAAFSYKFDLDFSKRRIRYYYDLLNAFMEKTDSLEFELFQFCPNTNCRRVFIRTKSNKKFCQPKCKDQEKEHQLTRDPLKRDTYERKKIRQRIYRKKGKNKL